MQDALPGPGAAAKMPAHAGTLLSGGRRGGRAGRISISDASGADSGRTSLGTRGSRTLLRVDVCLLVRRCAEVTHTGPPSRQGEDLQTDTFRLSLKGV